MLRTISPYRKKRKLDDPAVADDPVLDEFLRDMGRGATHLKDIVRFCRILRDTGRGGGAVDALAGIGGKNMTNVSRDVHKMLRGVYGSALEPFEFKLTTQLPGGKKGGKFVCLKLHYSLDRKCHF